MEEKCKYCGCNRFIIRFEIKKVALKIERRIEKLEREIIKLKNLPKCPKCKSNKNIIKQGTRKTLNAVIQRYHCKKCDWRFSVKGISFRMRNSERDIQKALWLRKKGYTLSQIAEIIGGISRITILRWLKKNKYEPKKEKIINRKCKNRWGTENTRRFKIHI